MAQSQRPSFPNGKAKSPKISIVTPSLNQGAFIGATLKSLHEQAYPDLEHIVVDGGSNDDTPAVLDKYRTEIFELIVEKDEGQYHALNRGFALSTGEIMGWINSDDVYLPNTLGLVADIFTRFPDVKWLTTLFPLVIDEHGRQIKVSKVYGYTRAGFLRGENLPGSGWPAIGFIQQESTFWRRSLWEQAGAQLDTSYRLAADFELWSRFFQHADLYGIDVPLGCFRRHNNQKTSMSLAGYLGEAQGIFDQLGGTRHHLGLARKIALWLRGSAPRPVTRALLQLRIFQPAPTITYDWSSGQWVKIWS